MNVECQLYEASEQRDPCPPGCCAMADEKDVRALMDAIERGDEESSSAPSSGGFRTALEQVAAYTGNGGPNTPWQDIVRSLSNIARQALKDAAPQEALPVSSREQHTGMTSGPAAAAPSYAAPAARRTSTEIAFCPACEKEWSK